MPPASAQTVATTPRRRSISLAVAKLRSLSWTHGQRNPQLTKTRFKLGSAGWRRPVVQTVIPIERQQWRARRNFVGFGW